MTPDKTSWPGEDPAITRPAHAFIVIPAKAGTQSQQKNSSK
jgi:hypothetical protein